MSKEIKIELPAPPSVNHYYRHVGHKTLISKEGREYREHVAFAVMLARRPKIDGRLAMHVRYHPPDRRRRDLDNIMKSLADSLQHAGVYEDDSQIDDLRITRCEVMKPGKVVVVIKHWGGSNE
ncbi:RusA family crossover junction endodeoxyribonuclease [bacterium]|nr:RusA family crossover junction endodeoxyribonuclease [bacterium]